MELDKVGRRETSQKTLVVIQVRDNSILWHGRSKRSGEKCWNFRNILKFQLIGFYIRCEKKKVDSYNPKVSALSKWKDGVDINDIRRATHITDFEEKRRSSILGIQLNI